MHSNIDHDGSPQLQGESTRHVLEHHTSFKGAESILWNNIIYGGSYSAEWSHERRPHFYIEGWPKNGNALGETEEIVLLFETEMPLASPLRNRPMAGVVNTHWNDSGFWQATILEEQTLKFTGAKDLMGQPTDGTDGGLVLKKLIALNIGHLIRTGCRQEKNSSLPKGPTMTDALKVILFAKPRVR